jgi:hypothetical protein
MKPNKIPIQTRAQNPHVDYLKDWMTSDAVLSYFGRPFALKADVLATLLTGGNLSDVARKYGVTRGAVSKQGRRAKEILATFSNQIDSIL